MTADEQAGPENADTLRLDIERTREQLGDTVEQLVVKADVKAQARAQAAALTGRIKGNVAAAAGEGRSKVAPVWAAAPEQLRRTIAQGASIARQRRVPVAAAVAVLGACYLALRQRRKR
jgi:hypothetical protein